MPLSYLSSRVRVLPLFLSVCGLAPLLWSENQTSVQSLDEDARASSDHGVLQGRRAYGRLPLIFEENRGQTDSRVRYVARGPGYTLFLTSTEAVVRLRGPDSSEILASGGSTRQRAESSTPRTAVVHMRLAGAKPSRMVQGVGELPGKSNYLGSDHRKHSLINIPHYSRVLYLGVLAGIDIAYYGNEGQLEYDLIASPGSHPHDLSVEMDGVNGMQIDGQGRLVLQTAAGRLWQNKPLAYQEIDGKRQPIACEYVLKSGHRVGFRFGTYDPQRRLIIDPVLRFSTHLGGSDSLDPAGNPRLAFTRAVAIAIDNKGNTYIAGNTDAMDFPTTEGGTISFFNGGCFLDAETIEPCDEFVAKFDPTGMMIYSTFLGDSNLLGMPFIRALTVDTKGQAYVAGYRGLFPEFSPAFVKKLSADGSAVQYEYRILTQCVINAIAVDTAGKTYIAGRTDDPGGCPATPGVFQTTSNAASAFIAKLDSTQSGQFSQGETLIYLTYLGGSSDDEANAIKVDENGNAYVAGFTISSDFPRTSSFGSGTGGAFVAKLNSTASKLIYSTLIHGAMATAVALDRSLNAYITGSALGPGFPRTSGAYRTTFGGGDSDAFVAKLSPGGGILRYSTYLGGSNEDHGTGIAVDGSGRVYVAGWTRSSDFPVSSNAVQKTFGGGTCSSKPCADAFVTTLNSSGTGIAFYSTLLGGNASDFANGLALDPALDVYLTGETYSSNFPVTSGAFQTRKKGLSDAFLSKLVIAADLSISESVSAGTAAPGSDLTYTVKASNKGPDTSDLPMMTDAIPVGTRFVSAIVSSGSCTLPPVGGTGTVTCRRHSMTKGAPWTLTLTVRLGSSVSSITNAARISAKTQDLISSNNVATVVTPVQ